MMERVRRFWDRWWRTAVSLAAVAIVATMAFVGWTVVDERRYFEEEAARDRRQDDQMTALIEVQQAANEDQARESAESVATALSSAEALLRDHFARHDENVALKLNELLHRIAALLERPAGTPPNPVNAVTPRAAPSAAPGPAPRTAPSPAPRSAPTTTTTPDQRSCTKRPDGPRC